MMDHTAVVESQMSIDRQLAECNCLQTQWKSSLNDLTE